MTEFSEAPGGPTGSGDPADYPASYPDGSGDPFSAGGPAGTGRRRAPGPPSGPEDVTPGDSVPAARRVPVDRRRADDDDEPGGFFGVMREIALVLGIALVLSLLIKTFLVQAFYIPSESMQNTLTIGDRVLVSKLTPGPFDLKRGDIVVFKDPDHWLTEGATPSQGPIRDGLRNALTWVGLMPSSSDEHLIKRVIGLPGDTVACCDAKGRITVNGVGIDEPYIFAGNEPSIKTFSQKVPAGNIWVMGDHRAESEDSRYHDPGYFPVSDVVGRAFVLVWPLNRFTTLKNPSSTFANVPSP